MYTLYVYVHIFICICVYVHIDKYIFIYIYMYMDLRKNKCIAQGCKDFRDLKRICQSSSASC